MCSRTGSSHSKVANIAPIQTKLAMQVVALNANGAGPASAVSAQLQLGLGNDVPSVPQSLTVTAPTDGGRLVVGFSPPASNGGSEVTRCAPGGDGWWATRKRYSHQLLPWMLLLALQLHRCGSPGRHRRC